MVAAFLLNQSLVNERILYSPDSGPVLSLQSLEKPIYHSTIQSISQTLDTELDENKYCKNYPFKNFQSFKDCDLAFVKKQLEDTYGIMPFWATENLDQSTKLRFVLKFFKYDLGQPSKKGQHHDFCKMTQKVAPIMLQAWRMRRDFFLWPFHKGTLQS